jgi:hypothetical protein
MATQAPITKAAQVFNSIVKSTESDSSQVKRPAPVAPKKEPPKPQIEEKIDTEDSLFDDNDDDSDSSDISDEDLKQVISDNEDESKDDKSKISDDSKKRQPGEPHTLIGTLDVTFGGQTKQIRIVSLDSSPGENYLIMKDFQSLASLTNTHTQPFQNQKRFIKIDQRNSIVLKIENIIELFQKHSWASSSAILQAIYAKFPEYKQKAPEIQQVKKTTQSPKKKAETDILPVTPTKKLKLDSEPSKPQTAAPKIQQTTKPQPPKPKQSNGIEPHYGYDKPKESRKKQMAVLVETTFDIIESPQKQLEFHKRIYKLCSEAQFTSPI